MYVSINIAGDKSGGLDGGTGRARAVPPKKGLKLCNNFYVPPPHAAWASSNITCVRNAAPQVDYGNEGINLAIPNFNFQSCP